MGKVLESKPHKPKTQQQHQQQQHQQQPKKQQVNAERSKSKTVAAQGNLKELEPKQAELRAERSKSKAIGPNELNLEKEKEKMHKAHKAVSRSEPMHQLASKVVHKAHHTKHTKLATKTPGKKMLHPTL